MGRKGPTCLRPQARRGPHLLAMRRLHSFKAGWGQRWTDSAQPTEVEVGRAGPEGQCLTLTDFLPGATRGWLLGDCQEGDRTVCALGASSCPFLSASPPPSGSSFIFPLCWGLHMGPSSLRPDSEWESSWCHAGKHTPPLQSCLLPWVSHWGCWGQGWWPSPSPTELGTRYI